MRALLGLSVAPTFDFPRRGKSNSVTPPARPSALPRDSVAAGVVNASQQTVRAACSREKKVRL